MNRNRLFLFTSLFLGLALVSPAVAAETAEKPWVVYEGFEGPGNGKHVVLVSGDEEYRSEEALPQLAKILAKHHGFKCTVLFAIDPKDGTINPKVTTNIPGLEALQKADLMIIATRFRNLPDEQMKYVVDYVQSGKPVIGLRTATHAFSIPGGKTYSRFSYNSKEWKGGFGKQVLGETWVAHHGSHGRESTRGLIAKGQENNPILRGIKDGDIWGPTDVYTVNLPLPGDSQPLVMGQVLVGMKPADKPVEGKKNDPMMPVAWTKTFKTEDGKVARVFTTTMGSSTDLESEGLRRLLVNASYWALGMEDKIPEKSKVDLVGEYKPLPFRGDGHKKGVKPQRPGIEVSPRAERGRPRAPLLVGGHHVAGMAGGGDRGVGSRCIPFRASASATQEAPWKSMSMLTAMPMNQKSPGHLCQTKIPRSIAIRPLKIDQIAPGYCKKAALMARNDPPTTRRTARTSVS